ncbi:MAG: nuclear transport factor 2 family protein [Ferruginibacter sp.]|nr:nuclear transport factor 2 family protein [Ferruginibacter sp.]
MKKIFLAIVIFVAMATQTLQAQNTKLFNEISRMDSLMFDAFNKHDVNKLMSFFSPTLEFYHDKGGLSNYAVTKQNFIKLFKNNANTGMHRQLVHGSMKVYPIANYGAIQDCSHKFCHIENGKEDCGVFKNIMVWQKIKNQWKVTRVISYDH